MRYNNYHKHDHYGNPWTMDVAVKPEDYCKRAVELGHTSVFSTNHGVTGNIFDWIELTNRKGSNGELLYNLKLIYGTEAYYVNNRFDKDRSNKHIIIIAKNNDGVMQLNDIMTEAHDTGFYYKPRIDRELLFSLDPKNFVITSACVAGLWNDIELLLALHNKFKNNFFLEVQPHNISKQIEVNNYLLTLSGAEKIPLIHANDSHYIYPEDLKYREILLKAKEIYYADESNCILDYPDEDVIYQRYEEQGVLSRKEVTDALSNTLIFDECSRLTLINDDIKLPPVSKTPIKDLKEIINSQWKKISPSIPKEKHSEYLEAIREEVKIIEDTNMANYFLIDYNVAKIGEKEYDGMLTNTGRGSAPSFYTTRVLNLTNIDRIAAPITLFPSRFMSVERILGSRSLPDIDLNTTDREPFIKATEDLLGKENCAWMISWKPLQKASAFRTYCKGIGLNISEYDEVAKDLEKYENDKKWRNIIKESEKFIGVVEGISESPCSMLLYNKPVRKELGLVKTPAKKMCCLLDGYNCDKFKYLKNDYLTVTVWAIIRDVCELANIPVPTINELDELLDEKTYDIYKNGLTCTINQADSDYATALVKRYCPHSVSEMSSFVAIIRPGCASLLNDFVERKPYTTGVKELDKILVEGNHRMIYQELIMKYLIWLGVPETGSYDIIKKIAKKKFKEPELVALKEKLLQGWMQRVGKPDGFLETWTVVEQAAKYSFNASHSLSYAYDSLYGAYLKAHYPLEYYKVAFDYYSGDKDRTNKLTKELSYFGIKLSPIKFRHSTAKYNFDKSTNQIFKGIASIKFMNEAVANEMFALRKNHYNNFIELLSDLKAKTSLNSRQLNILINLDFFEEFGDTNCLLKLAELYDAFSGKVQIKKDKLSAFRITPDKVKPFAGNETEKMFTKVDSAAFLSSIVKDINVPPRTFKERVSAQIEHLGYIDIKGGEYQGLAAVLDIDTKYSPKLTLYSFKTGMNKVCKVDKKTYNKCKLTKGDIVKITGTEYKPKLKRTPEGKFEPIEGVKELWITSYVKSEIQ